MITILITAVLAGGVALHIKQRSHRAGLTAPERQAEDEAVSESMAGW